MDFINLERTSSVAFRPNGVYKGRVVEVDETTNTVSLVLPRINGKSVRNRCKVLSAVMPSAGDEVGCVFAENQASEVYVLGIIRNTQSLDNAPIIVCTSSTRPDDPLAGTLIYETDTTLGYFWTGTTWVSVEGSEQDFGNVFFSADGLGIGAATASQPLSIAQTSGTDYVSYNKSASAGLTNASAGAVIIGRASGPNVVVDSTTYAANNGTGASTALTGTVVQARDNGNPAALYLNPNGGDVRLEAGGLVVNGNVSTLAGSQARLEMPLSATYIDSGTMASARLTGSYPNVVVDGSQITTGTVNFDRLGLVYPSSTAPAASASSEGRLYYDATNDKLLVHTGGTTAAFYPPWNMPWGIVGYAKRTSNITGITSQQDITNLSVTWTAVAGRHYRTMVTVPIFSVSGATTMGLFITDNTSPTPVRKGQYNQAMTASGDTAGTVFAFEENLSGTQTRKGRIISTTGVSCSITATSDVPAFIIVEDIGPSAAPA